MKIVILIIAHDAKNYVELQDIWSSYMNTHPNIKSYFIKCRENVVEPYIEENTIYTNGTESLVPGILIKTLESIKFLNKINVEYDYIFRTNLSSVLNLNLFYDTIKINIAKKNIDCAGVTLGKFPNLFISGAGMLLSKKICEHLVATNDFNYEELDDVAIGSFLMKNKYMPVPLIRSDNFIEMGFFDKNIYTSIKDKHYHFRCKCVNYDQTVILARKIAKNIYNQN